MKYIKIIKVNRENKYAQVVYVRDYAQETNDALDELIKKHISEKFDIKQICFAKLDPDDMDYFKRFFSKNALGYLEFGFYPESDTNEMMKYKGKTFNPLLFAVNLLYNDEDNVLFGSDHYKEKIPIAQYDALVAPYAKLLNSFSPFFKIEGYKMVVKDEKTNKEFPINPLE